MKKIVLLLTLACNSFTAFCMEQLITNQETIASIQPDPEAQEPMQQTMEIEDPLIPQIRPETRLKSVGKWCCFTSCAVGTVLLCKVLLDYI